MEKSCYMCDNPQTSVEHVPPKCIFPKLKDVLDDKDYRQNLITVPACDEHNFAKSKDDEYFMMVVASHFANNELASNQIQTKITRAWIRNPRLARSVCKNFTAIRGTTNYLYEIDSIRFNSALEHISHGLYFHSRGIKSETPFTVLSYPIWQCPEVDIARLNIHELANQLFSEIPIQGVNKEIFTYQITPEIEGKTLIRMNFYEAFVVVTTNKTLVADT